MNIKKECDFLDFEQEIRISSTFSEKEERAYIERITRGDIDLAELKKWLCEKLRIEDRRWKKDVREQRADSRNGKSKGRIFYKSGLDALGVKQKAGKVDAIKRMCGLAVAISLGIPAEIVFRSRFVICDDGKYEYLLGVYDPRIGQNRHGHLVIDDRGFCYYLRVPFGDHRENNRFRPPVPVLKAIERRYPQKES